MLSAIIFTRISDDREDAYFVAMIDDDSSQWYQYDVNLEKRSLSLSKLSSDKSLVPRVFFYRKGEREKSDVLLPICMMVPEHISQWEAVTFKSKSTVIPVPWTGPHWSIKSPFPQEDMSFILETLRPLYACAAMHKLMTDGVHSYPRTMKSSQSLLPLLSLLGELFKTNEKDMPPRLIKDIKETFDSSARGAINTPHDFLSRTFGLLRKWEPVSKRPLSTLPLSPQRKGAHACLLFSHA